MRYQPSWVLEACSLRRVGVRTVVLTLRHLGLRDRPLLQAQMDYGNELLSIVCHLLYRTRLGYT